MLSCKQLATWHLVEGQGHDDYTYACDEHIGAMRSTNTTCAHVIPAEHPCCYRHPLTNASVGLAIKRARRALGWSQSELGNKISRPRSHAAICDIERGKTALDVEQVAMFAATLGLTFEELLRDSVGD